MRHLTKIEWTHFPGTIGRTWNPVMGCSRVSKGCENCYAEHIAARFGWLVPGQPMYLPSGDLDDDPERFARMTKSGPRWTGSVAVVKERVDKPLRWKKPSTVFVNSMSDLFHERLNRHAIINIFDVMRRANKHTFIVLTKRPERIRPVLFDNIKHWAPARFEEYWRHIILGVSVEDQKTANERIPVLLESGWRGPMMVSYEPALGGVEFDADWLYWRCDSCGRHNPQALPFHASSAPQESNCWFTDCGALRTHRTKCISWVVAGGESGSKARASEQVWFFNLMRQCQSAGVPFFMKQITERGRKIRWEEFPTELKVREYPRKAAA